jgi:hypothetical protein
VVIVDDGSTDGTGAIAKAWAPRSRHQVVVLEQPNRGLVKTVARGYAESRGEFVSFLASDDWIFPTKIQDQVADLLATGADAVYGNIAVVAGQEAPVVYDRPKPFLDRWDPEEFIEHLVTAHGPMLQAGLFRRSVLDAIGGVDQGFGQEDWPIQILVARAARRVRVHPEPVVYYRYHGQNLVLRRSQQLLQWKCEIADKFLTGRTRRRAKGRAHAIFAAATAAKRPWRSLAHYAVAKAYLPRQEEGGYWRKVGRGLPDWGYTVLRRAGLR